MNIHSPRSSYASDLWYTRRRNNHSHLQGFAKEGDDKKAELFVHFILGASEYAEISTKMKPSVGLPEEPVVDLLSPLCFSRI